VRCYHYHL